MLHECHHLWNHNLVNRTEWWSFVSTESFPLIRDNGTVRFLRYDSHATGVMLFSRGVIHSSYILNSPYSRTSNYISSWRVHSIHSARAGAEKKWRQHGLMAASRPRQLTQHVQVAVSVQSSSSADGDGWILAIVLISCGCVVFIPHYGSELVS